MFKCFFYFLAVFLTALPFSAKTAGKITTHSGRGIAYFLDSENGNDANDGMSDKSAWQSLLRLKQAVLKPGDSIRFKRGSLFTGPLFIYSSGDRERPLVVTDYGDNEQSAPCFTNPVFTDQNYGNCIRIKGSYVILQNLHFRYTAAYRYGAYTVRPGWDTTTWQMGAVYIDKGATYCIVRNNEIEDCVVGVKSYGEHTLIEHNFIHDCNRVLKEWGWGPIGIWFGADYQEACFNKIFNYRAEDPRIGWKQGIGGGADGGAFEIDDARYDKSNISIHHNYTRDCQGFLEVTWTDIRQMPVYKNFSIHHNISDDYQQFLALWDAKDCEIDNNTIIRRKKNVNDWGVFNIAQDDSHNKIRNNVIITEQDIQIFNTGLRTQRHPNSIIENNLYFAAAGRLVIGSEGPGTSPVFGDPMLVNYRYGNKPEDFAISKGSIAIDKGTATTPGIDFSQKPVSGKPDLGAFESGQ